MPMPSARLLIVADRAEVEAQLRALDQRHERQRDGEQHQRRRSSSPCALVGPENCSESAEATTPARGFTGMNSPWLPPMYSQVAPIGCAIIQIATVAMAK